MDHCITNRGLHSIIIIGLIFTVGVCNSCNSEKVETATDGSPATTETSSTTDVAPASTDAIPRTNVSIDTSLRPIDVIPSSTDAAPSTTNEQPATRKTATLGYSYPVKMFRGESKNINVYVLIRNQQSRVRDTLQVIVDEQSIGDGDSVAINITNVIWYKTLSIELIDPANDFSITPVHNSNKQIIDTIDGNRWRWAIKTATDKKVTELILKIVAEKEDGTTNKFDDKTIHIEIQIDRNIVRRFINYLTDNPAVSVPILVSLFGFLGWWIKRRADKKKS